MRGGRFRQSEIVGLSTLESMMMTPGAQANELARIDTDMRAFGNELATAAKAHGETLPVLHPGSTAADIIALAQATAAEPAHTDPIVSLYRTAWLPLFRTWAAFYAANKTGAWWSNPVSEAEIYQQQLAAIRDQAIALGVHLQTPASHGEHPPGGGWLDDLTGVLKVGVYGALGLGGVYLIGKAIEAARK